MGFLGRFSAPKANIELKLNQAVYAYTDRLSGVIAFDPLEDLALEELRLDLKGYRDFSWERRGYHIASSGWPLGTNRIRLSGPIDARKGQRIEKSFQIDIPFYARSDPFMETSLKAYAVAVVKGRPAIRHGLRVGIRFPYVIKCERRYGGCGFVSPPSWEAARFCSRCGRSLEAQWDRKYQCASSAH